MHGADPLKPQAGTAPDVNDLGNRNNLNCASNEKNHARHIWDHPDANGHSGAMAWWIHDHLPYASLYFFAKLGAFNIGWHEAPERRIDYAKHGQPRYAVVWQEGQSTGYVIKPDASQPKGIRVQSVPVQMLQAFEAAGQASAVQLEEFFRA